MPGKGGPAFYELSTEHFIVRTDVELDDAREMVVYMERLRAALLEAGWQSGGEPEGDPLVVVVLADTAAFRIFAGGSDVGGYILPDSFPERVAVLPYATQSTRFMTLAHELTHEIAFLAMPKQPQWFAEGLATYFETAHFDEQGRLVLGAPDTARALWLQYEGVLPAQELFQREGPSVDATFYSSAWLLVHYLMSEHGHELAVFQGLLADGVPAASAFEQAFPGFDAGAVDRAVAAYKHKGLLRVSSVPVTPVVVPEPSVRTLSDADVYMLRSLLYRTARHASADTARQAEANVQLAMSADPTHARARLYLAQSMTAGERRLAELRSIVQSHPQDWYPWLVLADDLSRQATPTVASMDEADHALRTLRELRPRQVHARLLRGLQALRRGDRATALTLAKQALRARPNDLRVLGDYTQLMAALGACTEARDAFERLKGGIEGVLDAAPLTQIEAQVAGCVPVSG